MILVTLGTQDKKFYRLLDMIQNAIDNGKITDRVVVQAGYSSDYKSDDMEIFDLIPIAEFEKLVQKCDILITHGGVGSIINGLKFHKKIIAVPRLKKYKEHTNDHQLQIVNTFASEGYILKFDDGDNFDIIFDKVNKFKTRKYQSSNDIFVKRMDNIINKYL